MYKHTIKPDEEINNFRLAGWWSWSRRCFPGSRRRSSGVVLPRTRSHYVCRPALEWWRRRCRPSKAPSGVNWSRPSSDWSMVKSSRVTLIRCPGDAKMDQGAVGSATSGLGGSDAGQISGRIGYVYRPMLLTVESIWRDHWNNIEIQFQHNFCIKPYAPRELRRETELL